MRRLLAFDEALTHASACAAPAPAGVGSSAAAAVSQETTVACRMLAGDYPGAVSAGGEQPLGKVALLVSLAKELVTQAEQSRPHAR
jgi:hypothetical protein